MRAIADEIVRFLGAARRYFDPARVGARKTVGTRIAPPPAISCQRLPKGTPRAERLAAHRAKMERKWLARQRRNAPVMLQTLARLRERVASEAERGEGRAAATPSPGLTATLSRVAGEGKGVTP